MTVSPMARKDVLTKSGKTVGGGDISRKKKLLQKQVTQIWTAKCGLPSNVMACITSVVVNCCRPRARRG